MAKLSLSQCDCKMLNVGASSSNCGTVNNFIKYKIDNKCIKIYPLKLVYIRHKVHHKHLWRTGSRFSYLKFLSNLEKKSRKFSSKCNANYTIRKKLASAFLVNTTNSYDVWLFLMLRQVVQFIKSIVVLKRGVLVQMRLSVHKMTSHLKYWKMW